MALLLAQCIPAAPPAGQDSATRSTVSMPVLGLVFDSARGVRAVLGIPGAAVLGEPFEFPFEIRSAAVSPRQDYILVLAGEERECHLLRFDSQGGKAERISEVAPGATRVLLSPSGAAAALYREADGLIQVITGLPEAPAMHWRSTASGAPLAAMALSDDGETLLAASAGEPPLTWVLGAGGGARPVPVGPASGMAFRGQSRDAAVITADGTVWFLRDVNGAAEYRVVAGPDARFAGAEAVALSEDGARIFLASRSGTVAFLRLDGTATDTGHCRCAPSGLHPLNRAGLFRLNEPSRQPLMLWDAGAGPPRFWFVPPDPPPASTAAGHPDATRDRP